MRRVALVAALALACGNPTVERVAAPLDRFFYPTGIAVLDHRVIVASSNADLTYSPTDGGSVISVLPRGIDCSVTDPSCVDRVAGALNVLPFAGEIGLVDPAACPALPAGAGAVALVPIRGSDVVYRLDVGAGGTIACADGCELSVGDAERGEPFAMGVACDTASTPGGPSTARAYVGYLRSSAGQAWITQIDLALSPTDPQYAEKYVQHAFYDAGQVRSFAYDEARRRLYFTHSATGAATTLRYVELANGCRIDRIPLDGGCRNGTTPADFTRPGAVPNGLELRGIALANLTDATSPVRRAYVTARVYDPAATAVTGAVTEFDGLLIVADLSEDEAGNLRFDIVNEIPIGYGPAYVRVLPPRLDPITHAPMRDVVATIAASDGVVWIYDDETRETKAIGRDPITGAPLTGGGPFGLAVDPVPLAGNVARVYVGSFREHFVTPIDVPLDDPAAAAIPLTGAGLPARISGGVLP